LNKNEKNNQQHYLHQGMKTLAQIIV